MTMLSNYLEKLIEREGGYVDHPADRGGPTNWGITLAVARAYGYHGKMQDMPRSVAKSIYVEQYWEAPNFSEVNTHSAPIAEELLDTGVNMGPATAVRFLQRALNVFNAEGKHYGDIVVDGQLGRMTIAALRGFLSARGRDGHIVLVRALNSQQGVRYMEIAEKRTSQEAFTYGWFLHRVL